VNSARDIPKRIAADVTVVAGVWSRANPHSVEDDDDGATH
jgi:hypothetical protein